MIDTNVSLKQRDRARLRMMRFMTRGQETMVAYFDRYYGLASLVFKEAQQEDLINDYLATLDIDVQSQLIMMTDMKQIKTKEQLYNLAHRYDQSYQPAIQNGDILSEVKRYIDECVKKTEELAIETRNAVAIAALANKQKIEDVVCYSCKLEGHYASKCPSKAKDVTDWSSENRALKVKYEEKYGKPETDCPICHITSFYIAL